VNRKTSYPGAAQRRRASRVAGDLFIHRKGGSVDFDDHARLEAGEVGDKAAENHSAPKPETFGLLPPQTLPQAPL
jgi:hypothetical protein